jgi:3-oxoacyl-[acyl-carrier protein] reductase
MMAEAEKRVALVTGAARGIGLGIAGRLARDGAHVVMTDVLSEVKDSAAKLAGEGLSVEAVVGDVSSQAWTRDVVAQTIARWRSLDILVNNAGISPKRNNAKVLVRDTDLAQWQSVLDINLTGAFLLCRACVPSMIERKWGRIINISSQAGRSRSDVAGAAYGASKAGLIGFSRVLASEVGSDGVTVNCIAPGRIESPMQAVAGEEATRAYVARIPVGRIGTGADIAASVAFLASEEASFITGAIIDVNGGFFMG